MAIVPFFNLDMDHVRCISETLALFYSWVAITCLSLTWTWTLELDLDRLMGI